MAWLAGIMFVGFVIAFCDSVLHRSQRKYNLNGWNRAAEQHRVERNRATRLESEVAELNERLKRIREIAK